MSEEVWGLLRGSLNNESSTEQQRDARATKGISKKQQREAKRNRQREAKTKSRKKDVGNYASLHVARFPFLAQTGFWAGSWRPPGGSFARGKQAKSLLRPLVLLLCALEASCGGLGRSWGGLGRPWAGLGVVLGWSWAVLGRSWAVLGRSWSRLGAILGLFMSHRGVKHVGFFVGFK